ncbi:MAG: ribonuclease P protein component [Pseudomonadota bacterium]
MSVANQQSHKLGKSSRLKTPNDYRRVYQSKQYGGSQYHSFNTLVAEHSALGVTVAKKVSKSAVQRNGIRRQIKEFYRLRQNDLIPGVQLVITAKAGCAQASKQQRLDSLEQLWQKILRWQRWHQRQQP